jgi:hypothetical protein
MERRGVRCGVETGAVVGIFSDSRMETAGRAFAGVGLPSLGLLCLFESPEGSVVVVVVGSLGVEASVVALLGNDADR